MKRPLFVLIACEESQAECRAFRDLGHIAFSCDIQPCRPSGTPAWHIHADCLPFLQGCTQFITQDGLPHSVPKWDLIIAHPPCTYLCKVSAVWMRADADYSVLFKGEVTQVNRTRFSLMLDAREFFFQCLSAKAQFVAVENPIPMALAQLPRPSCYADPSWFGVKYTKKTCYWLRNLPPLMAELEYPAPKCYVRCSRGKYRARTFPQLAAAIARQWSDYILSFPCF